jgi:probable HAF family extracellular repeat protein
MVLFATRRRHVPRASSSIQRRCPNRPLSLEWLEGRCLLSYTITDLGTLGGPTSGAMGLSSSGLVTGSSLIADNSANHAFRYGSDGTLQDLGVLDGPNSYGLAINGAGVLVGYGDVSGGTFHAYIEDYAGMQDLGTLGGTRSLATAINDAGQITGYSDPPDGLELHAFLYDGGVMQDLGTLGGAYSSGRGINSAGEVTGSADVGDGTSHVFLYSGGTMLDLGTLGGAVGVGLSVNDGEQVTGWSYTSVGATHAFLNSNGAMQDLGTLGGSSSTSEGINNAGQVVGSSGIQGAMATHAFLYRDGTMTDLNSLVPPDSGWVLYDASGINDAGQIVGSGTNPDGRFHAYLLTPDMTPAIHPHLRVDPAAARAVSSIAINTQCGSDTSPQLSDERQLTAPVDTPLSTRHQASSDTRTVSPKNRARDLVFLVAGGEELVATELSLDVSGQFAAGI